MDRKERIVYLLEQYFRRQSSPAEAHELTELLLDNEAEEMLQAAMEQQVEAYAGDTVIAQIDWMPLLDNIITRQPVVARFPVRRLVRYMAAAAVLVLLLTGGWLLMRKDTGEDGQPVSVIQPGSSKAILTLSDGSTVTLDGTAGNTIIDGKGVEIRKPAAGKLFYQSSSTSGTTGYNKLTTPRGGQYQVQLPDGTKVWLNSASSITYPVAFNGTRRRVSITGEAYLEVAPDKQHPFMVDADGHTGIEVLGTAFNINAYGDEPVTATTLIEGNIRVTNTTDSLHPALLYPGQQGITGSSKGVRVLASADLKQVVAWKDGLFSFHDADIKTVMRQVSRWYDVEVKYAHGGGGNLEFKGSIQRDLTLDEMLRGLVASGLKYKIENPKTIVVMNE